jgi:hypothetical protein
MTRTTLTGHRGATTAVLVVGGGALSAATWAGGEHGLAVGLVVFYLVTGGIAYLWAGRDSDVAAIMRVGGDERQRRMDRDATAAAGVVMSIAAVVGAIIESARHHGNPGGYGVMCAVGGIAYTVSLVYFRHRG